MALSKLDAKGRGLKNDSSISSPNFARYGLGNSPRANTSPVIVRKPQRRWSIRDKTTAAMEARKRATNEKYQKPDPKPPNLKVNSNRLPPRHSTTSNISSRPKKSSSSKIDPISAKNKFMPVQKENNFVPSPMISNNISVKNRHSMLIETSSDSEDSHRKTNFAKDNAVPVQKENNFVPSPMISHNISVKHRHSMLIETSSDSEDSHRKPNLAKNNAVNSIESVFTDPTKNSSNSGSKMSLRVTKIRPSRNRMKKREIPLESKKSQDRDKPFTTSYSRSNSKSKSLESELMAETEEMNEALEELLEANRELKKEVKDLKGINNLKKTLSDKERERIISHGEKLMRRQEENNKNDRRKYEKTKQKLKEKEQQIRGILLATTYANATKTYRDHNSFEMMRIEKENQDLNIIVEDLRRDLKAALSILEKERAQSRLDFGKCAAIIEKLRQEKQQLENDNNNLRLQLES